MNKILFLPAALAAVIAVGCSDTNTAPAKSGASESSAAGTTKETDRVPAGDIDFVHDVAIANAAEIELGKMAQERASSPDVKKFGQMMVDDHTKAGTKLRALASQHGIPVPDQLDEKHRQLRDKLAGLTGTEFDRQYVSAMVDAHETVLDKLESRTDQKELANWKARRASAATGKKEKLEVEAVALVPEKSDNPVTMSINEWAAEACAVVYAHLEAAKDADAGVKKRMTH